MHSTGRNRGRPIRLHYIPMNREDLERMEASLDSMHGRRGAASEEEDDGDDRTEERSVRIGYILKPGDDEYLREMEELAEEAA